MDEAVGLRVFALALMLCASAAMLGTLTLMWWSGRR